MDGETKQKVTATVMSILDEADMDVMTEYKVRKQASDILSIDLFQPEPKQFVRGLIQSYLDARAAADSETCPQPPINEAEEELKEAYEETKPAPLHESEQVVEEEEQEQVQEEEDKKKGGSKEYDDDGELIVCRLSNKRRVTIQDFKGKTLVSIREFYTNKEGKELPSSKGISLTTEQWSVFKQNATAVDQAIKKLESR